MQNSLIRRKLIIFFPIVIGHARTKALALTEAGRIALGVSESEADRLGGPEHRYWKHRLAEHLRSLGHHVTEEAPLGGGRTVDVLAERDGRRIAFEVETGHSDALANVQKCLEAGVDKVVVVPTSSKVYEVLSRQLPKDSRVVLSPAPGNRPRKPGGDGRARAPQYDRSG